MDLLKLKAEQKKKKPVFVRQETGIRKRLKIKWRRPRGIHSKMREKRAGKRAQVRAGYRTLRKLRGFHRSGLIEVHVSNLPQLEKLNKETQIAVFSSTIGQKKKQIMLKKAIELGIKIANIRKPKKALEEIESKLKKKKEEKKAKAEEKKKTAKKPETKKEQPKKEKKEEAKKE